MSATAQLSWEETNQSSLMAAVAEVRIALSRFLADAAGETHSVPEAAIQEDSHESGDAQSALESLCATFGLSSFERKILLMCAGMELDSRFSSLYREAAAEKTAAYPTFSLALAAFPDAHWSALLPGRPLRHWHLVEVIHGDSLTQSPLRIDERILHFLTASPSLDERLRVLTAPASHLAELSPAQRALAERIALAWSGSQPGSQQRAPSPVVQLCAAEPGTRRAVAAAVSGLLGMQTRVLAAGAVPRANTDLDLFLLLWQREAALNPTALLLELDELDTSDLAGDAAVNRLIEQLRSPLIVSVRDRRKPVERMLLSFDIPTPAAAEQLEIWRHALGDSAALLNGNVERLAAQFSLAPAEIHAAVAQASGRDLATSLWSACRMQARPRLEGLARRIESSATWDDLVLPPTQKQVLAQIAVHVRQRAKVYEQWGFATRSARGLGIGAVFSGPSGTGKTMAGEVLAKELELDLYRIDLSQVVSKYIGETEKNLRRVFDAADGSGAVLLFDEADALFGKRSEVKDSHDRYANIEVGYLLQRMEAFRGMAILTTNRKDSMDQAFLRRIRFAAEFPFPDFAQRLEIWRRAFPRQTPTEDLRYEKLARLGASGGNIQNIAMCAAFLAADANEPVRMGHLLAAARAEFAKLERPLSEAETSGWT